MQLVQLNLFFLLSFDRTDYHFWRPEGSWRHPSLSQFLTPISPICLSIAVCFYELLGSSRNPLCTSISLVAIWIFLSRYLYKLYRSPPYAVPATLGSLIPSNFYSHKYYLSWIHLPFTINRKCPFTSTSNRLANKLLILQISQVTHTLSLMLESIISVYDVKGLQHLDLHTRCVIVDQWIYLQFIPVDLAISLTITSETLTSCI